MKQELAFALAGAGVGGAGGRTRLCRHADRPAAGGAREAVG